MSEYISKKFRDEPISRHLLHSVFERAEEDRHLIAMHPESAELIRFNAKRGMSRANMERIWGFRLCRAVLG